MQRRRGPKIVQHTDVQDQVIEQRTWFLLPLLTPPETLRACVEPSSLMPKTNFKGGDVVGECYNDLRCCDYPVSRSVCSCVLDKPVIWQRAVVTHFLVCVKTLCRLCDVSDSYSSRFDVKKMKIHSSCEIEIFDEAHLRTLCVILLFYSFIICCCIKNISRTSASREFDKFQVPTLLCKLRCWYL